MVMGTEKVQELTPGGLRRVPAGLMMPQDI